MQTNITIDESQRQLILMALAALAVEHPGFDYALSEIASKIDNPSANGPEMYHEFKTFREGARQRFGNIPLPNVRGIGQDTIIGPRPDGGAT
jgi:hypothetical protein